MNKLLKQLKAAKQLGGEAAKLLSTCHAELVSASNSNQTLNQVQGDNTLCHAEFISASNGKQIPNQVRNDNYAEFVGHPTYTTSCHPELVSGSNGKQMLKQVQHDKRAAFTLAEVLITIGIIGVIAALTIPALKSNIDSRVFQTTSNVFQRRLGEALKVMNSQSVLGGHNSTQEFVTELSRHMKILKTCEPNELTKCFPKEVIFNNSKVDISTITKAADLGQGDWDTTDVIGVQFADGVSALLAYNTACISNPYDNEYITISGSNVTDKKNARVTINTNDCLSILYDTNGNAVPNADRFKGEERDLREINVYALGKSMCKGVEAGKVCKTSFTPEALNCSDNSNSKYCGLDTTLTNDYWAGANKACKKAGGSLPSLEQLAAMATDIYGTEIGATTDKSGITCDSDKAKKYGISCDGSYFWSAKESSSTDAQRRGFFSSSSYWYIGSYTRTSSSLRAVCVGGSN